MTGLGGAVREGRGQAFVVDRSVGPGKKRAQVSGPRRSDRRTLGSPASGVSRLEGPVQRVVARTAGRRPATRTWGKLGAEEAGAAAAGEARSARRSLRSRDAASKPPARTASTARTVSTVRGLNGCGDPVAAIKNGNSKVSPTKAVRTRRSRMGRFAPSQWTSVSPYVSSLERMSDCLREMRDAEALGPATPGPTARPLKDYSAPIGPGHSNRLIHREVDTVRRVPALPRLRE